MNPEPAWGPGKRGKRDLTGNTWDIPAVVPIVVSKDKGAVEESMPIIDGGNEGAGEGVGVGKGEVHDVPSCSAEENVIPQPQPAAQEVTSSDPIKLGREEMDDASLSGFTYGVAKKK